MAYNNIGIQGRLTRDPELKKTPQDVAVCSFTLAVDNDGTGDNKGTDFINCVAWRRTAEFIAKYFAKGSQMVAHGRLSTRKYTDKEGHDRTAYEVVVSNAYFGGSKAAPAEPTPTPQGEVKFTEIEADGDLPF